MLLTGFIVEDVVCLQKGLAPGRTSAGSPAGRTSPGRLWLVAPTAGNKRNHPDSDQASPLCALHTPCLRLQSECACTDRILEQAFCSQALPHGPAGSLFWHLLIQTFCVR